MGATGLLLCQFDRPMIPETGSFATISLTGGIPPVNIDESIDIHCPFLISGKPLFGPIAESNCHG
jgi:hypothetical protein